MAAVSPWRVTSTGRTTRATTPIVVPSSTCRPGMRRPPSWASGAVRRPQSASLSETRGAKGPPTHECGADPFACLVPVGAFYSVDNEVNADQNGADKHYPAVEDEF